MSYNPTTATTIQLTQSSNGRRMRTIPEKIQTAIISLATTGIIGCAGFMWKVNETLAKIQSHIEDRDVQIDKKINDIQLTNNNIQLDIRELRDKTIRIETIQNPK